MPDCCMAIVAQEQETSQEYIVTGSATQLILFWTEDYAILCNRDLMI